MKKSKKNQAKEWDGATFHPDYMKAFLVQGHLFSRTPGGDASVKNRYEVHFMRRVGKLAQQVRLTFTTTSREWRALVLHTGIIGTGPTPKMALRSALRQWRRRFDSELHSLLKTCGEVATFARFLDGEAGGNKEILRQQSALELGEIGVILSSTPLTR